MEGGKGWSRKAAEKTANGGKNRLLPNMEKITRPSATLDRAVGDKMFPQRKETVGAT